MKKGSIRTTNLRGDNSHGQAHMESLGDSRGADNNASPGAPLTSAEKMRSLRSKRFVNLFCECGQPAVTRSANSMACQKCADLTSDGDMPGRTGTIDRAERHVGWTEFRNACNLFFEERGMETGVFHG